MDWKLIKRQQDERYGELEHKDPCVCTMGPEGVVIDYDCGRDLARETR